MLILESEGSEELLGETTENTRCWMAVGWERPWLASGQQRRDDGVRLGRSKAGVKRWLGLWVWRPGAVGLDIKAKGP